MPLTLPQRANRVQKPGPGVLLDRTHRLSQGLQLCFMMGESGGSTVTNAVGGARGILRSDGGTYTQPQWRQQPGGPCIYLQGVDTKLDTQKIVSLTTNTMTFAAIIDRLGVQGSGIDASGLVFHRANVVSGMNQAFQAPDKLGYHWNDDSNTYGYTGGPTIPTTGRALCIVAVASDKATLFCNGSVTVNTLAHSALSHTSPWIVGSQLSASYEKTFNGLIYAAWLWTRTLTLDDMWELYTDPDQMFAPPVWQTWPMAAAGGTSVPLSHIVSMTPAVMRAGFY